MGTKMGTTKQPRRSPLAQRICRKIAEHFAIHGPVIPDFGPSWNVAPQTFQPIVRLNRDKGEREIVLMRWWLIPYSYWAKDPTIGLRTINAKAETITARTFREAIKYRRCLVPADALCEWVVFEGAWARKWAQRNIRVAPLSRRESAARWLCWSL